MRKSTKTFIKNGGQIKQADIVVGIPSFNEADSIGFVAKQVDKGLNKYYKKYKKIIVNVDNHSPDGTKEVFLNTYTKNPKLYLSTSPGVAGKGNNFRNLFEVASQLKAKAVIVVDADLTSINAEWMKDLGGPILNKGYDFITPVYTRHEYDGSITNHICYPIFYGLLGKNIRQPIGGDFAMSDKFIKYVMKYEWKKTTRNYGIDIFLTTSAIFGDFKMGQVDLGAKIHKPSAPKLGPMFTQVVGTLFENLSKHKIYWMKDVKKSRIPILAKKSNKKPQDLPVDFKAIKTTSLYLFSINKYYLRKYLSSEVYSQISRVYNSRKMEIKPLLWSRIVYDMLYAYDEGRTINHFAESFKPLYFGRAATFIKYTLEMSYRESEREILEQAKVFYRDRDYLLDKYKK